MENPPGPDQPHPVPRFTRLELLIFLSTFFTFAFFNQGGGWNQNARFAEVRAMAEEGRFAINNFLVYRLDPGSHDLVRRPLTGTVYEFEGQRHRLCWVDMNYNLIPVLESDGGPGVVDDPMIEVCSSGDICYLPKTGHFHPNKPPGTSFLALPGYWVILQIERALGINPDHAWVLTVNVWLTTILSVGLISALGCVLFYRLAREFAAGSEWPAVIATLAFAFGTTYLPFGTILFDHNLTASLLVASFYFVRKNTGGAALLAGLCAGLAVLTNYVSAGAVFALGFYALFSRGDVFKFSTWSWKNTLLFCAGGLPLALVLFGYHTINFGSPLTFATDFQNPVFKDPNGALGMFSKPNPYVGAILLVSPYRGIFWLAPVLILGLIGLCAWLRQKTWVAEARLCLAVFAFFFLVNMSFNGYHGGYTAGPRYLVPGIPFLALGIVWAVARWKKVTYALMVLSIGQQLLLVATDAQNALAVGGHARLPDSHRKDDFFCNIVTEYAAPFFFTGKAGGLLNQLLEAKLDGEVDKLEAAEADDEVRAKQIEAKKTEWQTAIDQRQPNPFPLAALRGPVSINPVGVYDGLLGYGNFAMDSPEAARASCNLGEFIFPQSQWSLLPLFVVSGGLAAWAVAIARRQSAVK